MEIAHGITENGEFVEIKVINMTRKSANLCDTVMEI